MKSSTLAFIFLAAVATAFTGTPSVPVSGSGKVGIRRQLHRSTAATPQTYRSKAFGPFRECIRLRAEASDDDNRNDDDEAGEDAVATATTPTKTEAPKTRSPPPPAVSKPGVDGPLRLSSSARIDDYVSPVNFEKGVTKGPGPLLSPRWSDSGRWEKEQDARAQTGAESSGEQQFLLKEKYGTYFRVPNAATLMTSECIVCVCVYI